MKYLFTLILTLFLTYSVAQNPKIEILQINAKWNQHNDVHLNHIPKNHKGYFITVKYAMTFDGKISTYTGDSKWISCEKSRKFSQLEDPWRKRLE